MKDLSILIADDHEVVRRGIRTLLEAHSEWTIVGEAASCREALDKTRKLRPDLLLLDLSMPDRNCIPDITAIVAASPSTKVMVLTMHDSGEMASRALAAGASGYVLKSDAARDLVRAIQAIGKGQAFLSPGVTKLVLGELAKTGLARPSPESLTARELDVLRLLAQGRTNKAAAVELSVSVKTVDTHRASIMRKLQLETFSELMQFAIRHKLVDADP
jgi:DNA-binding NarL/FixJ family response regulator